MNIEEICREAWDATKKEHQPAYDTLEADYHAMLIGRAQGVVTTKVVEDGPFANFDAKVLALSGAPDVPAATKAELVQEVVDESTAEPEHLDLKGQLPKDFPAHDKLHEAGINTYGQLAKVEDLTAIEGIGPATAKQIAKRLKADEKALNK